MALSCRWRSRPQHQSRTCVRPITPFAPKIMIALIDGRAFADQGGDLLMIRLALPIVFAVVISSVGEITADTAQTLAEPAKLLPSASSDGELVGNSPESARKLLIDTLGATEMVWNNVFADNG